MTNLKLSLYREFSSVVVKDLRLKDEDNDKESSFKDKDKDLKIGPRGSSRTRTFREDNNIGVFYNQIGVNTPTFGQHPFPAFSPDKCKCKYANVKK